MEAHLVRAAECKCYVDADADADAPSVFQKGEVCDSYKILMFL